VDHPPALRPAIGEVAEDAAESPSAICRRPLHGEIGHSFMPAALTATMTAAKNAAASTIPKAMPATESGATTPNRAIGNNFMRDLHEHGLNARGEESTHEGSPRILWNAQHRRVISRAAAEHPHA